MRSTPTRTLAALAAVLAAVVAFVLWRSRPADAPAIGVASADPRAPGSDPVAPEPSLVAHPQARESIRPGTLEADGPRRDGKAGEIPPRVELIVAVIEPTNSPRGDHEWAPACVFPQGGDRLLAEMRQGTYAFRASPGRVRFLLHQPGFKPVERWFELSGEESVHREEVALEPAWSLEISLRSPNGQGVIQGIRDLVSPPPSEREWAPVAITASVDPPAQESDVRHQLRNGWIAVAFADDLRIDIVDEPPVHVSVLLGRQVLATQRLDTRVESITFTIEPDTVRSLLSVLTLQVVDALTARPADGVHASLVETGIVRTLSFPDSQGRVRFPPQPAGTYTLELDWENRSLTSWFVQLRPGEPLDLGTIALTSGVEISGRFSRVGGQPDHAWRGWIVADEPESGAEGVPRPVPVKADGRFSVMDLAAGRYVLLGNANTEADENRIGTILGMSRPVPIDTRTGPVRDLAIEMHPAVQLKLRPTIADFADYVCTIRSGDGQLADEGRLDAWMDSYRHVARGSYVLTLTKLGELVSRLPFDASSSSITLDVP